MTEDTKKILAEKLKKDHIAKRSIGGFSTAYIQSHHAIREANRAFGFDGWSYQIITLDQVSEEKNTNGNNVIGYTSRVKVCVGDISREDVGFGSGIAKMMADAHEGATKEAVSDAMKRALRTYGDIFGLALYDKKQEHVEKEEPAPQRNWIKEIQTTTTLDELKSIYDGAYKATSGEEQGKIILAKDKQKQTLMKESK